MSAASRSTEVSGDEDAIVVLGCSAAHGRPSTTMERRLRRAAELSAAHPHLPVVMSGGKRWDGWTEAQVMASWWRQSAPGPADVIVEEHSQTTRQNALFVARLCAERGYHRIVLITCDFHMPRAKRLFCRQALDVTPAPAKTPQRNVKRVRLVLREWGARLLERIEPWVS